MNTHSHANYKRNTQANSYGRSDHRFWIIANLIAFYRFIVAERILMIRFCVLCVLARIAVFALTLQSVSFLANSLARSSLYLSHFNDFLSILLLCKWTHYRSTVCMLIAHVTMCAASKPPTFVYNLENFILIFVFDCLFFSFFWVNDSIRSERTC